MRADGSNDSYAELREYAFRVLIAVGVTVLVALLLALLWLAVDVLLLGFAGVLLAVLLRGLAEWLARHLRLGTGWSLLLAIVLLVSFFGGLCWFSASAVVEQINTLTATLPKAVAKLEQELMRYQWGQWLAKEARGFDWKSPRFNMMGKMTGAISSVFGAIANVVIVCFLGIYLAARPQVYINGMIRLAPPTARPRARELLSAIAHSLRWWLVGILCGMTVIGTISGVGLRLLGIPFALALGLIAALFSFVPYLGAIVSAIPALLVAIIRGPEYLLYVGGLYLGIHMVEGYLLNPLIQQRAISLPPALLLFAQIMLGILLGLMGVVFAAPITAALLVIIKMLYIEDILGDQPSD